MADIGWAAISGGSQVVRKSIVIDASQNWTVPVNLAGNTIWLTGCGGGGGGALSIAGYSTGGFGGAFCLRRPVIVTAGSVHVVTIGAGGSPFGGSGGNTSFGSLVTLRGGSGGFSDVSTIQDDDIAQFFGRVGIRPSIIAPMNGTAPNTYFATSPDTVNGNVAGATSAAAGNIATGGAAGLFGNGTDATNGTASANAPANSGAGSGASRGVDGATGSGGSGRLVIEWEEFL